MNKILVCLLLLVCVQQNLIAQRYQPLQPGEKVPDIKIGKVENYKSKKIKISDFKGKWVLIDFWGSGCISCVNSFPIVDSMQQVFKDELQIILVSANTKDELNAFIKRLNKKVVMPDVPQVTADKTLEQLFPYSAVPHQVWIKPDGTLLVNGLEMYLKEDRIRALMDGTLERVESTLTMGYKTHSERPMINVVNTDSMALYYSIFSKRIPGIRSFSAQKIDSAKNILRSTRVNTRITALTSKAFFSTFEKEQYPNSIYDSYYFDVKDINQYLPPLNNSEYQDWVHKNSWFFEMQVSFEKGFEYADSLVNTEILKHLKNQLNITARIEKRNVRKVILSAPDGFESVRANPAKKYYKFFPELQSVDFSSQIFTKVKDELRKHNILLVQDFRNPDFSVDMVFSGDLSKPETFLNTFSRYGFKLTEKVEEMWVVFVTDK